MKVQEGKATEELGAIDDDKPIEVPERNWCQVPAPWVSNTSEITGYMVRLSPSQRWRRVFHCLSRCRTVDYFYVKGKGGKRIEVVPPDDLRYKIT